MISSKTCVRISETSLYIQNYFSCVLTSSIENTASPYLSHEFLKDSEINKYIIEMSKGYFEILNFTLFFVTKYMFCYLKTALLG